MRLPWQKKDKKVKELPEDATLFQKLWHDKQTHAAMVLGLWFIFIIGLLIFINIANRMMPPVNSNEEEKELEKITVSEMVKNIDKKYYKYKYTINLGDRKIIYDGELSEGKNEGYKEDGETLFRFLIQDDKTYRVISDIKEVIDDLYIDINKDFINYNYLYLLIWEKPYKLENEVTYIYNDLELPNNRTVNLTIETKDNNVTKIEIVENADTYLLEFSNIVEIEVTDNKNDENLSDKTDDKQDEKNEENSKE